MSKAKIASSFIKIKFHNIGSILIKTAGTYAVTAFALIQLSSIVVSNISTVDILGITSERFMQLLFIIVLIGFPLSLIIKATSESKGDNALSEIESYTTKLSVAPD